MLCRGGIEQIPDRRDRLSVFPDDLPDVALAHLKAEDRFPRRLLLQDDNLVGKLDEMPEDILKKTFHPAFLISRRENGKAESARTLGASDFLQGRNEAWASAASIGA